MAICDGNYKFVYVDVGCNGRRSDGGVFNNSSFANAMERKSLHLPNAQPLPGRNENTPYVIVADDAFGLKPNIMKPFPGRALSPSQRIFNYRLSRARRCIENAFGIMSAKFRVLRSPINLDAAKTRKITLACCALHNFLITRGENYTTAANVDRYAEDGTIIEGIWRRELPEQSMHGLEHVAHRYSSENAQKVRFEFEAYFMSVEGELPWQFRQI